MYYYPYEGRIDPSVEGFVEKHRRKPSEEEDGIYCTPISNDGGSYSFLVMLQKRRKKRKDLFGIALGMMGEDEFYTLKIYLRVDINYEDGTFLVSSDKKNRRAANEITDLIMKNHDSIVISSSKLGGDELAELAVEFSGEFVDLEKGEWIRMGRKAKERITIEGINIADILKDGEAVDLLGLEQVEKHPMRYTRFRITLPGYHNEVWLGIKIDESGMFYSIHPTSKKGKEPAAEEYIKVGMNAWAKITGERIKVQKQTTIDMIPTKP